MKKKWAMAIAAILIACLVPAGYLLAQTDNAIINLSGGGMGYSTALLTDPDKIPILVIRPGPDTRLEDMSFEIRLTNAIWDLDTFRESGIENFGMVDQDGAFSPIVSASGYLTGHQDNAGVKYSMKIGDRANVAVVTLDPYYPVTSFDALYIPILAEITGSPATLTLYDPDISGLSTDGVFMFASGSVGNITTQARAGGTREFSETVSLYDVTIRELVNMAMVSGVMSLRAPSGYAWTNIEQIQLTGRNDAGLGIVSRAYAIAALGAVDRAELRLELAMSNSSTEPRSLILRNLQLTALEENTSYGPVSITLSGCNMESETIRVANRIRADYTLRAENRTLPILTAGSVPLGTTAAGFQTLQVTWEEATPGRWRGDARTTFTLPAGIEAWAVAVSTSGLDHNLPNDTMIRRIDENAFGMNTELTGNWVLAANGLSVQNLRPNRARTARLELTFYVTVDSAFTGPVYLTAGGSSLAHEASVVIAEVVEKLPGGALALTIGSNTITRGNETMLMDVAPFIEEGYTMVPVSFVARAVGRPEDSVKWDGEARTVTIDTGTRVAVLTIDSREMTVNGSVLEIPIAALIRDGRTFVPFRVLGEQILGLAVDWIEETRTAIFR